MKISKGMNCIASTPAYFSQSANALHGAPQHEASHFLPSCIFKNHIDNSFPIYCNQFVQSGSHFYDNITVFWNELFPLCSIVKSYISDDVFHNHLYFDMITLYKIHAFLYLILRRFVNALQSMTDFFSGCRRCCHWLTIN